MSSPSDEAQAVGAEIQCFFPYPNSDMGWEIDELRELP
jgi:hypothetical protein